MCNPGTPLKTNTELAAARKHYNAFRVCATSLMKRGFTTEINSYGGLSINKTTTETL